MSASGTDVAFSYMNVITASKTAARISRSVTRAEMLSCMPLAKAAFMKGDAAASTTR
jgi:hypothetical protein